MATEKQKQAMRVYGELMSDVTGRCAAIEHSANGFTGLLDLHALEFCYLQLRMLCEIVALACLTAHGDIPETQTKSMQKEYLPDKILGRLERLHSNFYPCPVTRQKGTEGRRVNMVDAEGTFLTKSEIVALYGRCGSFLHKGNARHVANARKKPLTNFDEVVRFAQKFLDLLGVHNIVLFDERLLMCSLRTGPRGDVQVALANPT